MAAAKKAATKKARAKKPAKKPAKKNAKQGTAGKAAGRAAVAAWLRGVKPAHKPIAERVDRIVREEVPDARYAIKWSTPMYGRDGIGWFAAMASFQEHVGVNFFNGVALKPQPPVGASKLMRSIRLESLDDLDETQLRDWMRQAAKNRGWGKV